MPDIDDIWDDEEDLLRINRPPRESAPRLCRDLFDSNFTTFTVDLLSKMARLGDVRMGTEHGGDYRHTLDQYIDVIEVAAKAAKKAYDKAIADDNQLR
jgi:hypothetical protein